MLVYKRVIHYIDIHRPIVEVAFPLAISIPLAARKCSCIMSRQTVALKTTKMI